MTITTEAEHNIIGYLEDSIQPMIEKIDGVAEVNIMGGAREYISVELNEELMQQYGLTIRSVASVIANAEFETTVGTVERGDITLSLVGSADYPAYRQLASVPISIGGGNIIYLEDIASISMQEQERSSYSRYNGLNTVSIRVNKEQSGNTIDICEKLVALVDRINTGGYGFTVEITQNSGETIMDNINSVISSLILGLVVAVVVLVFFFGEWKASFIVGLSIPVSVLTALVAMSFFDMSINMMSLGGLVVGIGMMVDNSIVVIESCFSAKTEQRSFAESVAEGANLVTGSIIASTITTIVVFLPIGLMDGMSGQMFRDVCFTVVFSMLASLISALTLVPLFFVKMQPKEKVENFCNRILKKVDSGYSRLIRRALNARKSVILCAVFCLISAGIMFSNIKMELMPPSDEGTVSLSVDTKTGLSLDAVNNIMLEIEKIVSMQPDVENYTVSVGSSGGMGGMMSASGSGSISIELKDDRSLSTDEFVDDIRHKTSNIKNCSITANAQSSMSFGSSTEVEIDLIGENYDDLKKASTLVRDQLAATAGIYNTSSSISDGDPRAKLEIDPILAGAMGMTPYDVLQAASEKVAGITAMEYQQGSNTYDVIVEFPNENYKTVNDLYGLMIDTPSGAQVSVTDIAEIIYEEGPSSIKREDGNYVVTVSGTPSSGADITAMTNAAVAAAKMLDLPAGVSVEAGGTMDRMMEEFSALGGAMLTAIFLVFAVMAIQFESMIFSIVVMISIPFSLTGAFFGLAVTESSISMTSLLGLVMLVGIVVNNAIVLIDYTNILRTQGIEVREALVLACRTRLRPILMSTVTTVLGLLPTAMGIGGEVEMMQGMAIVVIGGLSFSTLLTLIVIPTFYLIFDREDRSARKKLRLSRKNHLNETQN